MGRARLGLQTFFAAIVVLCAVAIESPALARMLLENRDPAQGNTEADATIAGVWIGTYSYRNDRASVGFTFFFPPAKDNSCIGRSEEQNTFGNRSAPKLYAILSCSETALYPGQTLTIRKTYDGTGGVSHTVMYTGKVSADLRTISGEWVLNDLRGTFTMSR